MPLRRSSALVETAIGRASKTSGSEEREDLSQNTASFISRCLEMVPLAGLEPALRKELDFESSASTNFTTGATERAISLV